MRIAIIGGTGREGSGLALRWARAGHEVFVGSRDAQRGIDKAKELSHEHQLKLSGGGNLEACRWAGIILLAVPYDAHHSTLESIRSAIAGKPLIDITVPLKPPQIRKVHLPEGQSAALEAQKLLGPDAQVAAALHHISAEHLTNANYQFDCDVFVCADPQELRALVMQLVSDLGLRAIDAGALQNSIALEAMTPVLLHINKTYGAQGAGLRVTGLKLVS